MRWAILLLLLLAGCAPREGGELVDHESWALGATDPWPEHAPDPVDCSPDGWSYETTGGAPSLEVHTDDCDYLVVGQPSLLGALAGDELKLRLWHFGLVYFEPATAHAGIAIGGQVVFDEDVPIPSDSEMIERSFTVSEDLPEGSEVVFHLHNHGANTWNLVELSVNPAG